MRVLVGTSGWSYDDWTGPFYPRGTAPGARLAHYARRFPAAEVNYSHYRLPADLDAGPVAGRLARARLEAVVWKAPRALTHERNDREALARVADAFARALEPAARRGACHGVLLQFSEATSAADVLRVVEAQRDARPPAPLFVEGRHPRVADPDVARRLHEAAAETGGSLVAVDHPGAAFTRALPAETAYYRFHGRSPAWTKPRPGGEHGSERYDYLYPDAELDELAERVRAAEARRVLVFFNNHPGGNAPRNAETFAGIVGAERPAGARSTPNLRDFER